LPGLSNPAMIVGANAMKAVMAYAQLHWAAAGSLGLNNVTLAARLPILWTVSSTDGDFGLASQLDFTGGAPNGAVYSVSLWSASSAGTFYGEFILSGDQTFNVLGKYTVTAIPINGTATWSGAPGSGDNTAGAANANIVLPNFGNILYPVLRTMHSVHRPRRRK
jgi:hypothetical protein